MKTILLNLGLSVCLLFGHSSAVFADDSSSSVGDGGGNGGVACNDGNGNLTTLYYCGAYKEPQQLVASQPEPFLDVDGPSQIPDELADLDKYVDSIPYLSQESKDSLHRAIRPTFTRRYFSAFAPPALTAPIVERIKEEFTRATGIKRDRLTLYAVTDTTGSISNFNRHVTITYLLPAFFALPTKEAKMVALFHENLWAQDPYAKYSEIIERETAFEAMMAEPTNLARIANFLQKIPGNNKLGIQTLIIRNDVESGALNGFIDQDGRFSYSNLFGQDNISCFKNARQSLDKFFVKNDKDRTEDASGYIHEYDSGYASIAEEVSICFAKLANHVHGLRIAYPKAIIFESVEKILKEMISHSITYHTLEELFGISHEQHHPLWGRSYIKYTTSRSGDRVFSHIIVDLSLHNMKKYFKY